MALRLLSDLHQGGVKKPEQPKLQAAKENLLRNGFVAWNHWRRRQKSIHCIIHISGHEFEGLSLLTDQVSDFSVQHASGEYKLEKIWCSSNQNIIMMMDCEPFCVCLWLWPLDCSTADLSLTFNGFLDVSASSDLESNDDNLAGP